MADTVTLIPKGDPDTANRIIDAFAEKAGVAADRGDDGAVFDVSHDHHLRVVQTLDEIDPDWTHHIDLGQRG
jgi:hypothetical protein